MKNKRLGRWKLRKINTLGQLEKLFGFSAENSKIYLHPETYAKLSTNIKNYYDKIMPKSPMGRASSTAKTQLELMRAEFCLDYGMRKNRIIIKQKNEVE